jgi:plasmid stabilization system protein ParE
MPRGDKSKYTDKQERKADHIAESYESRGVPEQEAERRAWATVNKDDGGGKKSGGSGRGKVTGHPLRIREAGWGAPHLRQDRPPADRRRRERLQSRASETRRALNASDRTPRAAIVPVPSAPFMPPREIESGQLGRSCWQTSVAISRDVIDAPP